MPIHCTDTILMIRPVQFGSNIETAIDNAFQATDNHDDKVDICRKAQEEFDNMVDKLRSFGVNVIVVEDKLDSGSPDAVFPNNWISTHDDGKLLTYPLMAINRRGERRTDIIEMLSENFNLTQRYTMEYLEEDKQYLESTGSMALDRLNKVAYSCLSERTSIQALDKWCVLMGYSKCVFHAYDSDGKAIYHTNVMMSITEKLALVVLESIKDEEERSALVNRLNQSGKTIIDITYEQMLAFAGNSLQLTNSQGARLMVMSQKAVDKLRHGQLDLIRSENLIVPVSIPTIEKYGGGSVRCMILEVFKA